MSDRALIEAVKKMTGLHKVDQVTYINATVESVDEANLTCQCTIIDGQTENSFTARLIPVIDDGFILIPAIDSTVKVIFSEVVEPEVIKFSSIDKIIAIANESIQLNDGSFGGLVKIDVLINWLQKAYLDIQAISAALKTLGNPITPTVTIVKKSDFENELITHGE